MTARLNPIALLGGAIGLIVLLNVSPLSFGWLLFRINRLAPGDPYTAAQVSPEWTYLLGAIWLAVILVGLVRVPGRPWWLAYLAAAGLIGTLFLAGEGARVLSADAGPSARVSIMGGIWLSVLAYYVTTFAALHGARAGSKARALMIAPGPVAALALVASGHLAELALLRELTVQGGAFSAELGRHLAMSGTSVFVACSLGIPAAIWATRSAQVARIVLPTASLMQTLPSLALFGLLLAPLAHLGRTMTVGDALLYIGAGAVAALSIVALMRYLRDTLSGGAQGAGVVLILALLVVPAGLAIVLVAVAVSDLIVALLSWDFSNVRMPGGLSDPLSQLGVRGIGTAPALIALTLYALLPIVRNCYTGIKEVPQDAIEAGKGMGMSARDLLRRVELPIALPLIIEGIRASAVLTIGITTVAFLIGAGGLGVFIQRGIDQVVPDLILVGAIPIILLALIADALLRGVGTLVTSKGIRHRP